LQQDQVQLGIEAKVQLGIEAKVQL